jgi:transposase-like protein
MSHNVDEEKKLIDQTVAIYEKNGGNVRATAKELNVSRSTVRRRVVKVGKGEKPLAAGSIEGTKTAKRPLPKKGEIARYILTSAQNNTYVHESAWKNLEALAEHYKAEIIVGTYSYNQNQYGKMAVKRNKHNGYQHTLWYDPEVMLAINDERIELAPGLVWCGEYNALPTNVNPLASLESYTGRASGIFPHAKLALRSIPTMQGEGVKLNYTTGTVTKRNYIAKRAGLIAEFHHVYGGLLVEVNSDGHWWVRQLNEDDKGVIQDLDVVSDNGVITTGNRIEAITHGDLHGTFADPGAVKLALDIVDTLKPKYQFLHDVMEGAAVNPHQRKYQTNHEKFHTWLRGYHKLDNELVDTANLLEMFDRPFAKTVIVDSNHDDAWIKRWLREYDYRKDPPNTEVFLKLQSYLYNQIRNGVTDEQSRARVAKPKMVRDINVLEYALREIGDYRAKAKFLLADESFKTCGDKIENGMHGHLGPAGRFGTPENLSLMARKANTAHTHSTGIYNGLYVAGTLSEPRWEYMKGPNGCTQSETLTYPNGKRAIVTFYGGNWRAQ